MTITSKINPNFKWRINNRRALETAEIDFIKSFNPNIYHNDLECYLWAFDEKLPTNAWLENMRFKNDLTECRALVL